MSIDKNIRVCNLIDTYGSLLSERQQNLIKAYYFDDMSLSEIANNEGISRQAILDAIHSSIDKLENYEKCIKMVELKSKLQKCLTLTDVKKGLTKILEEI